MIDPWTRESLTWHPLGSRAGAWVASDGRAYPVTNGVVRITNPGSPAYAWVLEALRVEPAQPERQQDAMSVDSFGFQWSWDSAPRDERDLRWRVCDRFGIGPEALAGSRVLDAGCGAGAQSEYLASLGARIIAADLSSAIDVAADRRALRDATLIQGDLARLPLEHGSVDVVYCEGVLQHTEDLHSVLLELARVLRQDGVLLATHYPTPTTWPKRVQHRLREGIRTVSRHLPRDTVFLASGIAAALSFAPVVGPLIGQSIAVRNPRMPTLKATWSATYDSYGDHAFQRFLPHAEFVERVTAAGFQVTELAEAGVLRGVRR